MAEIATTKRTPKAQPAIALRTQLLELGVTMLSGIEATRDACEAGLPCDRTLDVTHRELTNALEAMKVRPFTAESATSWLDDLFDIEALMEGAKLLAKGTKAGATIEAPDRVLQQMLTILDHGQSGLPDTDNTAKHPTSTTRQAAAEPATQIRSLGERQAYWVFGQIASLADLVGELFSDVLEAIPGDDDNQPAAKKAFAGRQVAAQIKLLAGIGSQDVNALSIELVDADARAVLLPPSYHAEARKGMEVEA